VRVRRLTMGGERLKESDAKKKGRTQTTPKDTKPHMEIKRWGNSCSESDAR